MKRGRPAFKTYFFARQADLFPDPAYMAYLEKRYPYLAAMRESIRGTGRDGGAAAGPERASDALLGKPIRNWLSTDAGES